VRLIRERTCCNWIKQTINLYYAIIWKQRNEIVCTMSYMYICIDTYLYTFSHHGAQTLPLWVLKRKPDVCGNLASFQAIHRDWTLNFLRRSQPILWMVRHSPVSTPLPIEVMVAFKNNLLKLLGLDLSQIKCIERHIQLSNITISFISMMNFNLLWSRRNLKSAVCAIM